MLKLKKSVFVPLMCLALIAPLAAKETDHHLRAQNTSTELTPQDYFQIFKTSDTLLFITQEDFARFFRMFPEFMGFKFGTLPKLFSSVFQDFSISTIEINARHTHWLQLHLHENKNLVLPHFDHQMILKKRVSFGTPKFHANEDVTIPVVGIEVDGKNVTKIEVRDADGVMLQSEDGSEYNLALLDSFGDYYYDHEDAFLSLADQYADWQQPSETMTRYSGLKLVQWYKGMNKQNLFDLKVRGPHYNLVNVFLANADSSIDLGINSPLGNKITKHLVRIKSRPHMTQICMDRGFSAPMNGEIVVLNSCFGFYPGSIYYGNLSGVRGMGPLKRRSYRLKNVRFNRSFTMATYQVEGPGPFKATIQNKTVPL